MPFRKYLLIDSVDSAQILALNFFCLYPVVYLYKRVKSLDTFYQKK